MHAQAPLYPDHAALIQLADSLSVSACVIGRLNQTLRSPTCSIDEIAEVMRSDPSLCARVVRVSNSAFFGKKHRVSNLEEALQRVGVREVFRIVGTAALQQFIPQQLRTYNTTGVTFLRASLFSATASQLLAAKAGLEPNSAYLAGLMRPIGILVLNKHGLNHFENVDQLSCEKAPSLENWERENFGHSHAEVSACILGHWNFPEQITRSISCFNRIPSEDPLTVVLHIAGAIAATSRATLHQLHQDRSLQREWLAQIGIPASALPEISLKALRTARQIEAT